MAAFLGGAVQTTFAAISFAGAGYLFQHFNKNGYEDEIKRHNRALEELAGSKEAFYENEVKRRDKVQELRQKLSDANHDINDTNTALDNLRKVLSRYSYGGTSFSREPQLADFYEPSGEMKEYQLIFIGAIGIPIGYLAYTLF